MNKQQIVEIFKRYRFDPTTHIALGDIRLTIGDQEQIADEILQLTNELARLSASEIEELTKPFKMGRPNRVEKWYAHKSSQWQPGVLEEEKSSEPYVSGVKYNDDGKLIATFGRQMQRTGDEPV